VIRVKAAILFVAVGLLSASAAAGTIEISVMHTAELREGQLHVAVEVRNSGDEAAHSVTPILRFRGDEVRGTSHRALAPNQPLEESLAVPAGDLGEGRWPFLIVVEYTDASRYPFQALAAATLAVGSPPAAKVAVPKFESRGIVDTGALAIRVKNLSGTERSVSLGVMLPEALEATEPPTAIALAPWEEKTVSVPLVNRAALPGSRYRVFLAVEYEDGRVHQALVARGTVESLASEDRPSRRGLYLWLGAGVLGLLFVARIVYRLVKR
jgi:hypothetical protein